MENENLEQSGNEQNNDTVNFNRIQRRQFNPIANQGCATLICGIIIVFIILFKIRGVNLQDVTSKWIDYGNIEKQSDAEIKIFPTKDSYTAILNCGGLIYLINCADNFNCEAIQDKIGDKPVETLFLISDASKFLDVETKKVYTSSEFSRNYYSNGSFMEDEIGLPDGKLEMQLKDDTLKFHYVSKNKFEFSTHFNVGNTSEKCDVLINSNEQHLSALAKKTYLDNNDGEKFKLQDYSEITIDMINRKVYAD